VFGAKTKRQCGVNTGEKKMEEKFSFEDLKVYRKALEYVDFVYSITKGFPKVEAFSLTDQFRRAAVSICLNIAEGTGGSKAEFNQFLKISRRSVRECLAITEIASRQHFINSQNRETSRNWCAELSKMLSGLMNSLKK
jgi:four helix bundle protein